MSGGNGYHPSITFSTPPERLVSLVPSMTASLFDLGLGERLIGRTRYCPPSGSESAIAVIGGSRDPDVEKIVELKPDLVLANQEENDPVSIEKLESAGIPVWVTFPKTIKQAIEILWIILKLLPSDPNATNKILLLERTIDWARRSIEHIQPLRVFYPIWMDEYEGEPYFMTVHGETYAHDVLRLCGADNVFANRVRRYPLEADLGRIEAEAPGERDIRYPRVSVREILETEPEMILLPDEPFAFEEAHREQISELLVDTPAVHSRRIYTIEGRYVHWHGTTVAHAIAELPAIIQGIGDSG
jgi:ABC-type Fe3+-hydroxamate transport system substrate-binding protein